MTDESKSTRLQIITILKRDGGSSCYDMTIEINLNNNQIKAYDMNLYQKVRYTLATMLRNGEVTVTKKPAEKSGNKNIYKLI